MLIISDESAVVVPIVGGYRNERFQNGGCR
jgi:hypothetical protein